MEHGELFKKIRKERRLSQEAVASGVSARETLTKFENNHSNVTLANFLGYLDNIGMDFYEYSFLYNHYNVSDEMRIRQEFITQCSDPLTIVAFIEKLEHLSNTTHKKFYLLMAAQARIFQYRRFMTDKKDIKQPVAIIKKHLLNVESWSRLEFSTFNNCMFVLETPFVLNCYRASIQKMQTLYQDGPYNKNDFATLQLNLSRLMIERQELAVARDCLTDLLRICEKENFLYEKLVATVLLKFVEAPTNYNISQELAILEYFNLSKKAQALENFLTKQKV